MKIIELQQKQQYTFNLTFQNGEILEVDLTDLVAKYVSLEDLKTAQINSEWGCLEFLSGTVDIEPKTLYKYAIQKKEPNLA